MCIRDSIITDFKKLFILGLSFVGHNFCYLKYCNINTNKQPSGCRLLHSKTEEIELLHYSFNLPKLTCCIPKLKTDFSHSQKLKKPNFCILKLTCRFPKLPKPNFCIPKPTSKTGYLHSGTKI